MEFLRVGVFFKDFRCFLLCSFFVSAVRGFSVLLALVKVVEWKTMGCGRYDDVFSRILALSYCYD